MPSVRLILSIFSIGYSTATWAGPGNNSVALSLRGEPPQLSSLKTSDLDSAFVLGHVEEGLVRHSKKSDGTIIPGVAEKWTTQGLTLTFKIRKNAKWSNGSPVTANDFVYAWRLVVTPKTASQSAALLYPILNAQKIAEGKLEPKDLGAQAIDDHTLKVTLERPCAYFLTLLAFPTFFPVLQSFHEKQGDQGSTFAANAENILYNGPYVLTEWVHGSKLTLKKNPHYWNASQVKIETIEIPYLTPDPTAKFNLFKDQKLDLLNAMAKDDLPRAQKEGWRSESHLDGGIHFLEFNLREGRATANKNLRKAFQLAFGDRKVYLSQVIAIPGNRPAFSLIPSSVAGVKKPYLVENPVHYPKEDLKAAKAALELAKKELGGSIPALTWLTNDNPLSDREAQFFQQLFKSRLGLDLKIDKQILKQRIAKMNAGEFDIAASNWSPDYPDPMTYAELKASWYKTNRGRFVNAKYDEFITAAQNETNPTKRGKLIAQANQILTDEAAVIPTYESMIVWTKHKKLDGVIRRAFGPDPDFTYARWNH